MIKKQKTLKQPIVFEGIGVHTGLPAMVTLFPCEANTGLIIRNKAFPNEPINIGKFVPEHAMHATVVKQKSWFISTLEHLMAAIYVAEIDNLLIEIEGIEVPILDGSALPFIQKILDIGLCEQNMPKLFLTPKKFLKFEDAQGRFIEITPAQKQASGEYNTTLYVDYTAEFNHPLAGNSALQGAVACDFFVYEIAPARTFGFLEQLPYLRQHGLAKGTSLGNTVVIGQEELLNDMRIADECVRHKFLDLIGDLSLLGKNLIGSIKAHKTGHSFNRLVIDHYIKNPEQWELV